MKWNVGGGMDEYLADAATDTLYKNAFLRVCLVSLLFFFLFLAVWSYSFC